MLLNKTVGPHYEYADISVKDLQFPEPYFLEEGFLYALVFPES